MVDGEVPDLMSINDYKGVRSNSRMPGKYQLEIEEKKPPGSLPLVFKVLLALSVLVLVTGIILIIYGVVSLSKCNAASSNPKGQQNTCSYSSEAKRAGLDALLEKVKTAYYKMNPNNIVYSPDSTREIIRGEFSPYNCHPEFIKKRTDAALELYKEAQDLAKRTVQEKLNPREAKALAQVLHFLQSNFGSPYDENYYAGDWMLGPNLFCWQAICYVGSELKSHFTTASRGFTPRTVDDVDFIINTLKKLKASMVQYVDNLKYGVKAGFVRSVEQCEVGLFALQRKYKQITQLGPQGGIILINKLCIYVYIFLILSSIVQYIVHYLRGSRKTKSYCKLQQNRTVNFLDHHNSMTGCTHPEAVILHVAGC